MLFRSSVVFSEINVQEKLVFQSFLRMPRPKDELLLHIDFGEYDGLGVSPGLISFGFQSESWRERLPAIRSVATEFGLQPFQDEVVQICHVLSFRAPEDVDRTAISAVALLRACGLTDDTEIVYSAGALDESEDGAAGLR